MSEGALAAIRKVLEISAGLLRLPIVLLAAFITPFSSKSVPKRENSASAEDASQAMGIKDKKLTDSTKNRIPRPSWPVRMGRRWLAAALCQGKIPRHIAFIMDGNRRYARRRAIAVGDGHALGFNRLRETLDWCLELGVHMVTVYAFSLENFKRPDDEVDALMNLCRTKFELLMGENELIQRHGVRINVLGDMTTLPQDLQKTVGQIVTMSRHNSRLVLNIALAYTSRHEITEAAKCIARGVASGTLLESDVTQAVLEQCLFTEDAPPPDLLVRTSGETRLSDFMLWQGGFSCIHFTPVLWPDFSFWDFVKSVLHFQQQFGTLHALQTDHTADAAREAHQIGLDTVSRDCKANAGKSNTEFVAGVVPNLNARVQIFLKMIRSERDAYFERLASS